MAKTDIVTLDLNFQNRPRTIASFLIRHSTGVILIESGPGSTLPALESCLTHQGFTFRDITHVLLTHIHLDHAGAAGWLSRQGAEIYVHPIGAPHLLKPEKLLASASRIYGDQMSSLWGEFLAVEKSLLRVPVDMEEIKIGNHAFIAINTPGHADHHYSYLFDDVCFSGDVGGVRIPGYPYLRAPMPPPELHFGKWRESLARLHSLKVAYIAPTHFGVFEDPTWQLNELDRILTISEGWLEKTISKHPSIEQMRDQFTAWMDAQGREQGLSKEVIEAYALANPLGMSADGLMRYWRKFREADDSTNVTRNA